MLPKISIITVCYNAEKEIESTILSVINQSYPNIEYIIVDGASSDNTMSIVNRYKDKISLIISEPDKGIYDAMNKGINLATGDWINFMNAGDKFASNDVLMNVFADRAIDADLVYGNVIKNKNGKLIKFKAEELSLLRYRMPFSHQSVFILASLMKEHLYEKSLSIVADFNFFHKMLYLHKKFLYIDVDVAEFESVMGVSSKQYWKSIKQNHYVIMNYRLPTYIWDLLINYCRGVMIAFKRFLF